MFQNKNVNVVARITFGLATWLASLFLTCCKTEAAIVLSSDYDAGAIQRGVPFAVQTGGNVAALHTSRGYASSLVYNYGGFGIVETAGHVPYGESINNLWLNTAANFNSSSAAIFFPSRVFIDPTYGGTAGTGSDHAILIFNSPFSGVGAVTFATTRGISGSDIWLSGYGIAGNRTDGYLGQTGDLRAGTSRLGYGNLGTLGYDDNIYFRATFRPFPENATDIRGSIGDSGSPAFSNSFSINPAVNNVLGLNIAASNSITGNTTILLDFTNPHTSAFRDSVFIEIGAIAVPESSSVVLVGLTGVGAVSVRRLRRKAT